MKERPLATPARAHKHHGRAFAERLALVLGAVLLLTFGASRLNLSRSMGRLHAKMLAGARDGNYYAVVDGLSTRSRAYHGDLENVITAGSRENIARLRAARESGACDVAFGLAQDGLDFGGAGASGPSAGSASKSSASGVRLELIGHLLKSETVFFFGKNADAMTELSDLAGKKIAIGPEGSGVSAVVEELLSLDDFKSLDIALTHVSVDEGLALAQKGDVDLAVVVMDEDAPLIGAIVRDRGLQIAGFSHADVIARRLPHMKTGRIGAGQYEAVKLLPKTDKRVLRVDTLVLGNGCAGRSATIDLLALLAEEYPDFVRHEKETPNTTGLALAPSAKSFFENGGPELADEYVPWLVDVMPPANWAYIVMGVSLLFNAMSAGHRFRLWRIDDARVKLENKIATLFGPTTTLGDIEHIEVKGTLASTETKEGVVELVDSLEALAARSRRQSLSMLVPMGQEMAYRYQEGVIYETIAVLRSFLRRQSV